MAKRAIGINPLTAQGAAVDSYLTPAKLAKKTAKRKTTSKGTRKGPGRPPAGLRPGERVSDYKRITLWMPPDAKRELDAVSRFLGRPQWAVVVEAIAALQKSLSPAERKALELMRR